MSSRATRTRFSGTYPAVLVSLVVFAAVAFPLGLFALVMPRPWGYFWAALVVSAMVAVIVRARRICLVVAPDGVEVHNLWRSYRLPWESIAAVSPTGGSMLGEGPGEDTIEFVLRGGRRIQSQATFGSSARHTPVLRELQNYAGDWNIDMPKPETMIAT